MNFIDILQKTISFSYQSSLLLWLEPSTYEQ